MKLFNTTPSTFFLLFASGACALFSACSSDYEVVADHATHIYLQDGEPRDWESILSPSFCEETGQALVGSVRFYDAQGESLWESPVSEDLLSGSVTGGSRTHLTNYYIATLLPSAEMLRVNLLPAGASGGLSVSAARAHEEDLARNYTNGFNIFFYPGSSELMQGEGTTSIIRVNTTAALQAEIDAYRCAADGPTTVRVFALPAVQVENGSKVPPLPRGSEEPEPVVHIDHTRQTDFTDTGAWAGRSEAAGCRRVELRTVTTKSDPLNVREAAHLKARKIATLKRGQTVEVCIVDRNPAIIEGRRSAWQKVLVAGSVGYLNDRYLSEP